jgi:hypothetical protein
MPPRPETDFATTTLKSGVADVKKVGSVGKTCKQRCCTHTEPQNLDLKDRTMDTQTSHGRDQGVKGR